MTGSSTGKLSLQINSLKIKFLKIIGLIKFSEYLFCRENYVTIYRFSAITVKNHELPIFHVLL